MTHPFQRALLTGASRGLGLALARELCAAGTTVVGVARHEEPLRAALEPLGAHALPADLAADTGRADPEALVTRASSLAGGPFDLFVHAASTLGPLDPAAADPMPRLAQTAPPELRQVFEVNVLGPARWIRALHRSMRRAPRADARDGECLPTKATVLVISSDAAVERYPGWGPYGASKAALDHLIGVWATEEPELTFLSIDPGEMDTEMHAAAMPDADRSTLARPADVARRILRWLPVARSGTRALASAVA